MLHRCADGLCSHIFLGNSRNAAHRSAGERPKDSKVLRRSLPMVIGHTYLGHVRRGSPNLAASIALRVFSQISRVATAKVFVETGFVLPPYGGFSRSSIKGCGWYLLTVAPIRPPFAHQIQRSGGKYGVFGRSHLKRPLQSSLWIGFDQERRSEMAGHLC